MRLRQLDSLRGIAALSVLSDHLVQTFATLDGWQPSGIAGDLQWFGLRSMIGGGVNAVLIFFALSGFVLALSFTETDGNRYTPFAIKRVTRIYLPFAFAILFAALLYLAVQPAPIPAFTPWFNRESWYELPSFDVLAGHLLMTGRHRDQELDNVMWSLVHELRISLIFPLVVLVLRRFPRATLVSSMALALAAAYYAERVSGEVCSSFLKTLSYLYLFVAGACCYCYSERIRGFVGELGSTRLILWALCFSAMFLMPNSSGAWFLPARNAGWGRVVTGLGACGFLVLCYADNKVQSFLLSKFTLWLGRISYSLYLLHLPILLAIAHIAYGRLPLPLILILAAMCALAAADLSQRCIERPAQQLGKSLAIYISTARKQRLEERCSRSTNF